MTMVLPITAFVTAVCALLLLITAIDTVKQRLRLKVAFGDAGDARLTSASRSHANLAEHAPIVILMLGLLEMSHVSSRILMGIAAIFVVGRIAHIIGLYTPSEPGKAPIPRQIGVTATWLSLTGLSLWILWILMFAN
jgi:uncharacterized membrane protein YecN with MAPEG domain